MSDLCEENQGLLYYSSESFCVSSPSSLWVGGGEGAKMGSKTCIMGNQNMR